MLAYLDPSSNSEPGLTALVVIAIVVAALVLLGLTIYVAVRLANRRRD